MEEKQTKNENSFECDVRFRRCGIIIVIVAANGLVLPIPKHLK